MVNSQLSTKSNANDSLVPVVDIIIQVAKSVGITSIRKDFWKLFDEIKSSIHDGKIKGMIGREAQVDIISLNEFMKAKRKELNVSEDATPNSIEDIKKLIINLNKSGLTHDEILLIVAHRLGINI